MTDRPLQGKRALVGGASRGIGRACAQALAEAGAGVIVAARSEDALQALAAELDTGAGQAHEVLAADYDQPDKLAETVKDLAADRPVHILVNNSAGPPGGPIFDAAPAEFETAFRRHLVCNQLLSQCLVPGMREAGYGRIVNIISTSVKEPIPGLGVSNTIRAAVAAWAKTLADELGPDGITVNNVLPGYTRTDRLQNLFRNKAEKTGKSLEQVETDALAKIPLGRFTEPRELAAAVAFLASPQAACITGHSLPVDGGRLRGL